ncbi:nicotinate-nucleotide adenylyltransferase [Stylonychia lemnae]|uniref:Nicotinate-nucleotide adenylyltransferase n=1 Tax=Stylonychia lemnae TaxID=5949 RepID=A0A078ARH0_STYLE|nr:nicotinate-nucleotide adenylyltransferase [Stylonychia lemnae]|eukprot:CDW84809.1 nicotinate-nucleotide adenylyltransferase [Stylonychia lemnae]
MQNELRFWVVVSILQRFHIFKQHNNQSIFQLAAETLNVYKFDAVWLVPCGDRIDKNVRTQGIHRALDIYQVSDIEIKNGEMIPTYHLMKKLEASFSDKFFFVIGSDLIPTLNQWHEGEKLLQEIDFVIFNRIGYEIMNDQDKKHLLPKNYEYQENYQSLLGMISSTEVRNRIKNTKQEISEGNQSDNLQFHDVAGLITKGTLDYIKRNSLY